jgi:hypothetical protein
VFVDVTFLTEVFADFVVPQLHSIRGTLAAAFAFHDALPKVSSSAPLSPSEALKSVIAELGVLKLPSTTENLVGRGDFGYSPFGDWVARVARAARDMNRASVEQSMSHFKTSYLARLSDMRSNIATVYPALDEHLTSELNDAIEKTLAMTLGAQLAFHYLTAKSGASLDTDRGLVMELQDLLLEGI